MNQKVWAEWKDHPVTQEFFHALKMLCDERASTAIDVGRGISDPREHSLWYARCEGYIEGIKAVIEGDFEDE